MGTEHVVAVRTEHDRGRERNPAIAIREEGAGAGGNGHIAQQRVSDPVKDAHGMVKEQSIGVLVEIAEVGHQHVVGSGQKIPAHGQVGIICAPNDQSIVGGIEHLVRLRLRVAGQAEPARREAQEAGGAQGRHDSFTRGPESDGLE